jgi:acetolactate synthase small subunit
MNRITLLIFIALLLSSKLFAQINPLDSTVQVISYWDNKEKQNYKISTEKYKVKGSDTTSRENLTYEVDITIIDSTENSYTVEWLYKNYQINTDNKFTKALISLGENMNVIIKTDENGSFKEVVNWEYLRDFIKKSLSVIQQDFKDTPKINEITNQVLATFGTKEAIQTAAIKDILQFHTFHGGLYKLGEEYSDKVKVSNLLSEEPFDCELTVLLDEINHEDNNSILRMWQNIDSDQLTKATYNYLKNLAISLDVVPPKPEDLQPLKNNTSIASRIHGPSGWVVYSVETTEISSDDTINFEERIIELQ